MSKFLGCFPNAHVWVDEKEVDDYVPVVPKRQLFTHPGLDTQGKILNYAVERTKSDYVMSCDDDFEYVYSMVETWPRKRKAAMYSDAGFLDALIRNGVQMLKDMEIGLYGWNGTPHPLGYSNADPYSLTRLVQNAILFDRRKFNFTTDNIHFDADCTLWHLLHDRFLLRDNRFYWNFGAAAGNAGGYQAEDVQGRWSADELKQTYVDLKAKWKKHFVYGGKTLSAKQGTTKGQHSFGVSVNRKSSGMVQVKD